MADETDIADDDPFVLAGAYVLGTLEGEELVRAQRASLEDMDFRAAIEWWEWRLGAMAEAAPAFAPSPEVWTALEARIDRIEQLEGRTGNVADLGEVRRAARPSGWSIAAALTGAGLAAVALALYVATPSPTAPGPVPGVAAPGPQLVAQLQDETGERRLASRIDRENQRLALSIAGLTADEGLAPELWVIPEGGTPVSLGSIPQAGEFERELTEQETALLQRGATIAVTFEEDTGVKHAEPTPPILLAGALDQV